MPLDAGFLPVTVVCCSWLSDLCQGDSCFCLIGTLLMASAAVSRLSLSGPGDARSSRLAGFVRRGVDHGLVHRCVGERVRPSL